MIVTFIGGGNMASAIIGGRIAAGASPRDFRVVEPFDAQRAALAARFAGIALYPGVTGDAVADAGVAVIAVKPQQARDAAKALAPHAAALPVVLSIAAGIRGVDLSRWLGGYPRIVRAMPNTPALVGAGISGLWAAPAVDATARDAAASLLRAGGDVLWFDDEASLDAVTAVSGSGPAYVFYLLEAMEAAAIDVGLAQPAARRLAYATVAGGMALAQARDADPATLRAEVTSKGGTTARAVETLERHGVKEAFVEAIRGAALRAKEMGDEFGRDA
ncbi:MAG: pyrroline-5-carboxylate reductase [Betaproteobacteria bacterium]